MKASKYGQPGYGAGTWWVEIGSQPETYTNGPYDDREEAEAEARHLLAQEGRELATIGEGEEVDLCVPDADEIIERMTEGVYEQCGESGADFLDSHRVNQEQRNELTDAVERVVAEWMTKHALWPKFCKVEEAGVVTAQGGAGS